MEDRLERVRIEVGRTVGKLLLWFLWEIIRALIRGEVIGFKVARFTGETCSRSTEIGDSLESERYEWDNEI